MMQYDVISNVFRLIINSVTSPLPKEQDQLTFEDEPMMAFEGHASPLRPQPTHASPVYFYVLFILILANNFSHR